MTNEARFIIKYTHKRMPSQEAAGTTNPFAISCPGCMMPIEPGLPVYIVHDQIVKNEDLLKATVYGIRGKRIVLSQTKPPLPDSFVGKSVIVSFLDSANEGARRWGCLGVHIGHRGPV